MAKVYPIMVSEYNYPVTLETSDNNFFFPHNECLGVATTKEIALDLVRQNAEFYEKTVLPDICPMNGSYKRVELNNGYRIEFEELLGAPIAVFYCVEFETDVVYDPSQFDGYSRTVVISKEEC